MQKITPFIWFNDNAEEAMVFYTSLFKDSKIVSVARMPETVPPQGKALLGIFEIAGQQFYALNGGPNEALQGAGPISLFVNCETQEEIDRLWEAFAEGGMPIQCGWIRDKFGLTWQIVPNILNKLMSDPDKAKAARVAAAMMQMVKFDIKELERAAQS